MSCEFSLDLEGDVDALFERARQGIQSMGGSIDGDRKAGSFRASTPIGAIAGRYTMSGKTVRFVVEKKPMLVSCAMIEQKLREAVAG